MQLRPLIIDDAAKAKIANVIAYAMDHPFIPGKSPVPGDNPSFVVELNTYRCVFTFTRAGGVVLRHLTISVPSQGKFANPIVAFMIAELFGFKGYDLQKPERPAADWMIDVRTEENAVMIAQET